MISPSYTGPAYYYYKYEDMLEFGHITIERYSSSNMIFRCLIDYFFGYNSYISGFVVSSNQLHGQAIVDNIYKSFYTSLDELDHRFIIKNIFSCTTKLIGEDYDF